MKELLEYIVKNIVNNPDAVVVTESNNSDDSSNYESTIYYIKVDEPDIGILIGKGGKTIKSIRNIAKVKAIKEGKFIDVRVDNDE